MSNTQPQPQPKTRAEYKAAIEAIFREMAKMDERIAKDQAEIDRLTTETRAMLDDLRQRAHA